MRDMRCVQLRKLGNFDCGACGGRNSAFHCHPHSQNHIFLDSERVCCLLSASSIGFDWVVLLHCSLHFAAVLLLAGQEIPTRHHQMSVLLLAIDHNHCFAAVLARAAVRTGRLLCRDKPDISFLSCFNPAFSDPLLLFVTFNLLVPLFVILGVLFITIEAYLTALPVIQKARTSIQEKLKSSRFFPEDTNFEEEEYSTTEMNGAEQIYTQLGQVQGDSLLEEDEFVSTLCMQQIEQTKAPSQPSKLPKITELIFTLLNAAYFPVSLMSFSVLPCTDGYMSLYPWIACDSSTRAVFVTISALVMILFVFGYPIVLLIVLLFNHFSKRRLEKVFKHYKDGYAYYELVFIVQKLLLVMFLTLLVGFVQQLMIVLVLSASLILHHFCSPFESKSLNHLQVCSGVVLVYAYAFDVLNGLYSGNPHSFSLVGSWFMAFLVMVVLILFFVLIVRSHWFLRRLFCRKRKDTFEALE